MSTTGKREHKGFFKVPSLRNIAVTSPYMHDGRFATLEDVINHSLFRTNIITSSSRHILKSEFNPILLSGLLLAYLANAVSRNALGHFFSRAIFEDHRNPIKILEKRHFAFG